MRCPSFLLYACFFIHACSADKLAESAKEPVFYADLVFGLDSFQLKAGVDNYYMFSYLDASEKLWDTNQSALAKADCPGVDCPETFIVEFYYGKGNFDSLSNQTNLPLLLDSSATFDELGIAVVAWIDADGREWRSNAGDQDADSFIETSNWSDFPLRNADGLKVKSVHLKFSCWVYDSTGASRRLKSQNSLMAVAMP